MSEAFLSRHLLAKHFGGDVRMIAEFEAQAEAVKANTTGVEDTVAMKDATVIVLSANGDFTNERVLTIGEGIDIAITDNTVTLSVKNVALTEDFKATLIPPAEVVLFLPAEGTLVSDTAAANLFNKSLDAPLLSSIPDYANDAAAAAGGVEVGQMYRTASALKVRVA